MVFLGWYDSACKWLFLKDFTWQIKRVATLCLFLILNTALQVHEPRIWELHGRPAPGEGQSLTEARLEHRAAGHFQARPFLADTEAGGLGGLGPWALRCSAWPSMGEGCSWEVGSTAKHQNYLILNSYCVLLILSLIPFNSLVK